jgi:hypothetical protein
MRGQRITEFLKENTDITNAQYSNALKRMKRVILEFKKDGLF